MIKNRSPFFFVGDKYKLMEQLKKYFPKEINKFIEPFCGGGSVFLSYNAKQYFANDKNDYMIKLHKFLLSFKHNREGFYKSFSKEIKKYNLSASFLGKTVSDELKTQYKKTYYAVYNKEGYNQLRSDFNKNKSDLLKLYVLLIYGFNHMLRFNKNGDFNLPVGNVDYNKNVKIALDTYFNFVENNEIQFDSLDFEVFLNQINYEIDDFVYLDPPYLISNCEYNKGWNEDEEKRLLTFLDKLNEKGIKFALSNVLIHKEGENKILKEWIKKYKVCTLESINYISYHNNSLKNTKEVLIINY